MALWMCCLPTNSWAADLARAWQRFLCRPRNNCFHVTSVM